MRGLPTIGAVVALLWLLIPTTALAAPAFVNGGATFDAASGTAIAGPSTSLTEGNLIVVGIRFPDSFNNQNVTRCADTARNVYHLLFKEWHGNTSVELWYATGVLGNASNVVTCTLSGSLSSRGIAHLQFSGVSALNGGLAFGQADAATVSSRTTLTTTVADTVVVGYAQVNATGGAWTAQNNYASGVQDASTVQVFQYRIVSSVQSGITATATSSNTNAAKTIIAAAFSAPAGSASGSSIRDPK